MYALHEFDSEEQALYTHRRNIIVNLLYVVCTEKLRPVCAACWPWDYYPNYNYIYILFARVCAPSSLLLLKLLLQLLQLPYNSHECCSSMSELEYTTLPVMCTTWTRALFFSFSKLKLNILFFLCLNWVHYRSSSSSHALLFKLISYKF